MTRPLISALGLCHTWPDHTLFDQLSFRLPPGVTLLLGGDGSGKTTLLRLLSGAEAPQAGTLHLRESPYTSSTHDLRHNVFWLHPDDPGPPAWHNAPAREALNTRLQTWPQARPQDADALCEVLELTPHLDKPMYMLSTGSQRKVWLAAALCAQAPITLLEKPLAALDSPSRRAVVDAVIAQAQPNAVPPRAWLWADYEIPKGLPVVQTVRLGD